MKKLIIFNLVFLILLVFIVKAPDLDGSGNNDEDLSNTFDGSTLITELNFSKIWDLNNDVANFGDLGVDNTFDKQSFYNIIWKKHNINLSNNNMLSATPLDYSLKINIETNQIRWNGTIYKLNSTPQRLQPYYRRDESGKLTTDLLVPNIFFGENNARINFQQIGDLGGYALVYNNIVELKIDLINILPGQDFFIDPIYYNSTDGFSTADIGSGDPYGITTNGTDFWIADITDDYIYHTDKSGYNFSDGFSTQPTTADQSGITTNGTDFWIVDSGTEHIWHFANGVAVSGDFGISAGSSDIKDITTNGTDFWIVDNLNDWLYHTNNLGSNISDGFSLSYLGSAVPESVTTNGTDFWIADIVGDKFLYHTDKSGYNFSDGIYLLQIAGISPKRITKYSENKLEYESVRPHNFYITDPTDDFIYHIIENYTIPNSAPFINLQSPKNNTLDYSHYVNFSFNVSDVDLDPVNCSFYLNDVLNSTDISITQSINQSFNLTNIPYGNYNWTIGCYDGTDWANSTTYNFSVYDNIIPSLLVDSIENQTISGSRANVSINYITSDESTLNISYKLVSGSNQKSVDIISNTSIYTFTDIFGEYNLTLYATDSYGNQNETTTFFKIIFEQGSGLGSSSSGEETTTEIENPSEEPYSPENPETVIGNPAESSTIAQETINNDIQSLIDRLGSEVTEEDLENLINLWKEQGLIVDISDLKQWYDNYVNIVNPIVSSGGGSGSGTIEENIGTPSMYYENNKNLIMMTPYGAGSYNLYVVQDQTLSRDLVLINDGTETEKIYINIKSYDYLDLTPNEDVKIIGAEYEEATGRYYVMLESGQDLRKTISIETSIPENSIWGQEYYMSVVYKAESGEILGKNDFKYEVTRKGILFALNELFLGSKFKLPLPDKKTTDEAGNIISREKQQPIKIPNILIILGLPFLISLFGSFAIDFENKNGIGKLFLIFFSTFLTSIFIIVII